MKESLEIETSNPSKLWSILAKVVYVSYLNLKEQDAVVTKDIAHWYSLVD